jgi:hypothetical protein
MRILYGQDSENVIQDPTVKISLHPGDTRFIKKEKRTVYDFVGFVIHDKETLAVFPKHYFSESELSIRNKTGAVKDEDILLLFQVLRKYTESTKSKAKADRYLGSIEEYESDYPFQAFFDVYDYYTKYGIYFEEEDIVTAGQKGKISWKHTIQRSNVIVSGGNIVYIPLYSKQKNVKSAFISDCMIFVINHTIRNFPYFLSIKPITGQYKEQDFIRNRDYVLRTLYQTRNHIFKDIHKKLVSSLIDFFEEFDSLKHGGAIHLKINYFDAIWEAMVHKYLNDCFAGIEASGDSIVFDETLSKSPVSFNKATFEIDNSVNGFKIMLDHYGIQKGEQYIFDSKYYYKPNKLNYKQFTYNMVVDSYKYGAKGIKTYSALLLPGNKVSGLHLDLKKEFGGLKGGPHQIIEQYLDIKKVMMHYVES